MMKTFRVPYDLSGYVVIKAANANVAAHRGKKIVEKLTDALAEEGEIIGRVPSKGGVTEVV